MKYTAVLVGLLCLILGVGMGYVGSGSVVINLTDLQKNAVITEQEQKCAKEIKAEVKDLTSQLTSCRDSASKVADRNKKLIEVNEEWQDKLTAINLDLNKHFYDVNKAMYDLNCKRR